MKKVVVIVVCVALGGALLMVLDRMGLVREGDVAPSFTATLSTGETMSLGDYRGKNNVVLFFYPKDFTAGCTQQVCSYRDNYAEVRALNAVMLGVSYDVDTTHASFISTYQLPFPLISDRDKSISKAYGTARLGGVAGLQKRVTFVIDKQGIVRKVAHHEFAIQKHIEDVLETLRKLQ